MAKHSIKELDEWQLDFMWNFLKMGNGSPDPKQIKNHCNLLRRAMIQKTSGQGRTGNESDVPFEDIGTIVNCIVIEAMQIHLAGGFDILDKYWSGGGENEAD